MQDDDEDEVEQSERRHLKRELLVSSVAALAVLVSGGVSALATIQTNENTLQAQSAALRAQQDADTRAFIRDSRRVAYSEVLDGIKEMVPHIDDIMREVDQVNMGARQSISAQNVRILEGMLVDFLVSINQVNLLGSEQSREAAEGVWGSAAAIAEVGLRIVNAQEAEQPREEILRHTRALDKLSDDPVLHFGTNLEKLIESFRNDLSVPAEG